MFNTIADPADCEVRSVIRFLNAKKVKPAEIHRQLVEIYGENVMTDGMVRKRRCELLCVINGPWDVGRRIPKSFQENGFSRCHVKEDGASSGSVRGITMCWTQNTTSLPFWLHKQCGGHEVEETSEDAPQLSGNL
ncbi:hypothetical protein AVEN_214815-1 [Araneus ventricosus]|uniref:Mos1 transposase HTH domain-containing protein n=1 Tax=Araneus ventricosus TaxID=182803 RepID=A0A4Y2UAH0_ARAVE|nr:hypothetical protein AVEN_214815-1 [Araneus ventricosus]